MLPLTPRRFLDADEVASLLGMEGGAVFLRRRARLQDDGFPEPMPGHRRPLRWREDQVLAWIEASGRAFDTTQPARPQLAAAAGPNVHLLRMARSA